MNSKEIKKEIENGFIVENDIDFVNILTFFTEKKYEDLRLKMYEKKAKEDNTEINEAKNNYLEQCFNAYIKNKLMEALNLAKQGNKKDAIEIVDSLEKIEPIFKSYDIKNKNKFISDSDNRLTVREVEILFMKPELNVKELNDIYNALTDSLTKKHNPPKNKNEFIKQLISHPLIKCMDSGKNFNRLQNHIDNDVLETGFYKELIQAVLEVRKHVNDEVFQGFLVFLIKEDLTKGLSNILREKNYQPIHLQTLLKKIIIGEKFNNSDLDELSKEISKNYTGHFALNSKIELEKLISSKFSLNDYGFDININNESIFIHGHATENSGNQQNGQHPNTTKVFRKKGKDTIGMTVITKNIVHIKDGRTYLYDFAENLNITKMGTLILSQLQFDADFLKLLSSKNYIDNIEHSDILASNLLIVKDDIQNTQKLALSQVGKSDLNLIMEKKNFYCELLSKNEEFFKKIFTATSSNNQMLSQFISIPLFETILTILKIEKSLEKTIFTENELKIIKNSINVDLNNNNLESLQEDIIERLEERKTFKQTVDFQNSKELINLSNSSESIHSVKNEEDVIKGYQKILKNMNIDYLKYFEENPLEKIPKPIVTAMKKRIVKETEKLMTYTSTKSESIVTSVKSILNDLQKGETVYFTPSDYNNSNSQRKTLSFLLSSMHTNNQSEKGAMRQLNDLIVLRYLCDFASLMGSKIKCSNKDIELLMTKKLKEVDNKVSKCKF